MDNLYNSVCQKCSELITKSYSTSFTLGIRMFHKNIRKPIFGIYGFVRLADEIVDTYKGDDRNTLLEEFRMETFLAISRGVSLNPVLHTFQQVVNQYQIDHAHIHAFLDSMEMDLDTVSHDEPSYKKYIFGSAEVIGLMCLRVFVRNDDELYLRLEPSAKYLGSAFQKVNFLRDFKSDFKERGRIYFPEVDFHHFSEADKIKIEAEIKAEFDHAREGIRNLPPCCRFGVYSAYKYYLKLFDKIKRRPISTLLSERIRVPNGEKLLVLTKSAVRLQLGIL
ncbi:MAG: phytoene/squalene synthase family protein [Saprospiraceae bacterium]|nr:phytoene/squalene synthase family protein [Saprospiraceae bacterium]